MSVLELKIFLYYSFLINCNFYSPRIFLSLFFFSKLWRYSGNLGGKTNAQEKKFFTVEDCEVAWDWLFIICIAFPFQMNRGAYGTDLQWNIFCFLLFYFIYLLLFFFRFEILFFYLTSPSLQEVVSDILTKIRCDCLSLCMFV